jgi:outer membrane protein assembly factor BamE (lipoprotein component of BamABCDE complex)
MKNLWIAGFLMLCVFAAGCESLNPYKVAEKNVNNTKQLRVGMTKAQVLAIMGEPLKDEGFARPDIWYYYFENNWLDGMITEEECFPLIFKDGKLIGWGNNFHARWRLENKDRVPDVQLPPEASIGDNK